MPKIDIHNLKTSAYCPFCHQYTLLTVVINNLELYGTFQDLKVSTNQEK